MNKPLEGIKVVEFGQNLAGPYCGQILAFLGAEVVKVERPEGDDARKWGPPFIEGDSVGFIALNRGKKSITLNLSNPEAQQIVRDLAAKCDVLLENYKVGDLARYGLGYEDLKKVNPSIIYAYSLGYARRGPYGHKPAFDDLVQGVSGAASLQSRVDGLPPRFMPSLIADKTTGLHLCIAVLGALYHRQKTGEGQLIEVPMLETLASFWLTEHLFGATWTPERGAMGYDRIINKFRHPFQTNDGYICALPYTDAHWLRFFEIVERPDLAKDPRFSDRTMRPKHFSELYQVLDSLMKHRSTQEWLDAFDALVAAEGRERATYLLRRLLDPSPPPLARLIVGYSGWGPGQLERELEASAWLMSDIDRDLIFATPPERMWEAAIRRLGADPATLQMSRGVH